MTLLRVLTLVYAAVLVLAVAAALATIAFYLWRIAAGLARVRSGLVEVRERTAPLREHLGSLEAYTEDRVQQFEKATAGLERVLGSRNEAAIIEEQVSRL